MTRVFFALVALMISLWVFSAPPVQGERMRKRLIFASVTVALVFGTLTYYEGIYNESENALFYVRSSSDAGNGSLGAIRPDPRHGGG